MQAQNNSRSSTSFQSTMLYLVCLVVGIMIGYLVRGTTPRPNIGSQTSARGAGSTESTGMTQQMPTMEQMKGMADKQAEPLLKQLQTDPNNPKLLFQIGTVYEAAHQFKDATSYFDKALAISPKDVDVLTEKASCLYYAGDADHAITTLETALQYSPTDSRVLFNLGMLRWRSKGDAKAAIELWQKLLTSNPKLDAQKRAQVEELIKQVKAHPPTHITGN
ncbi:MAG TPA: tetratricopeptide repeat protein [Terriglobales bacterium]|nr:tetratricopeptide repeat protein [Terriglobales bacterium]